MGRITRREFVRKSVGVAALASLGAGGLAGCAGSQQGSANKTQGPVTIEYWHINTEAFGGPAVKDLVSSFQKSNPGITVRERFHPNAYTGLLENLQTSLASKTPPDVAQIGYNYLNYVTSNFPFTPTEELAKNAGDSSFFTNFPDNLLQLGQVNGKQVGMPYALSNIVTYYNADMLKQAGVNPNSPPRTWEEWRQVAPNIKEKTGKPGIYLQVLDDNWSTQAMIESNGGKLLDCQGGEWKAAFNQPEAVKAIQFWADLIKDGLALNLLWTQGAQAFLSGEVATNITTIAQRANLQKQAKFDLRATTFPRFGTQQPKLPAGGNNLFVFSQDSAKQRAAWEFIKFLESPEGLTVWTKGTGYLPPRKGVADDPKYLGGFMKENPIEAVAVEQVPMVIPWRSFPGPNGLQASKTLFSALQEALGGQSSADKALRGAADKVNQLISGQKCP